MAYLASQGFPMEIVMAIYDFLPISGHLWETPYQNAIVQDRCIPSWMCPKQFVTSMNRWCESPAAAQTETWTMEDGWERVHPPCLDRGKWCSFGRFWNETKPQTCCTSVWSGLSPGSSRVPDLQSQPQLRGLGMHRSCILDLQGRVGCCPLKNRGWFSKIFPTHQDERFSGIHQVLVSHTVCMIRAAFFKLPERVEDFKTSQVHMIYSFFTGKNLHEWKKPT